MKTSREHEASLGLALSRVKNSVSSDRGIINNLSEIKSFIEEFSTSGKVQKTKYAPAIMNVIGFMNNGTKTEMNIAALKRKIADIDADIESQEKLELSEDKKRELKDRINEYNRFSTRLNKFNNGTTMDKMSVGLEFENMTEREINEKRNKLLKARNVAVKCLDEASSSTGRIERLMRLSTCYNGDCSRYEREAEIISRRLHEKEFTETIEKAISIIKDNQLEVQLSVSSITWLQTYDTIPEFMRGDIKVWQELHSEKLKQFNIADDEEYEVNGYDETDEENEAFNNNIEAETLDDFSSSMTRILSAINDIIKVDFEIANTSNKKILQLMKDGMSFKEMALYKKKEPDKESATIRKFGLKEFKVERSRQFIDDYMNGRPLDIQKYGRYVFLNKDGTFGIGDGWISLREKQMALWMVNLKYPEVKRLGFFGPYLLDKVRMASDNWGKNEKAVKNAIKEFLDIFDDNYVVDEDTFITRKPCDKTCILEDLNMPSDIYSGSGNHSYRLVLTGARHGSAYLRS